MLKRIFRFLFPKHDKIECDNSRRFDITWKQMKQK